MGDNIFINVLLSFVLVIVLLEALFLLIYKISSGKWYSYIKSVPFSKLHYKPHPYLPYILKNEVITKSQKQVQYSLHTVDFPSLKANKLNFYNGPNGDRDIIVPKPENLIRINCLGASTTGNYIEKDGQIFTYPLELEKILAKKYKNQKKIEVNNCGQGGYNTADLLVRSALQIVDTTPDYLIIYHAHNDIRSYLSPGFKSDYSHSRKNIGEVYWKYALGEKIPDFRINFLNFIKNKFLPSNIRWSLLDVIAKEKIDLTLDYSEGLKVYERNISSIISLFKQYNTKVILCTFSLFLHDKVKNDPLFKLYEKIVNEENKIIKNLSTKYNLDLVDCDKLIEKKIDNFLDTHHFTPKGMNILAKVISDKIIL